MKYGRIILVGVLVIILAIISFKLIELSRGQAALKDHIQALEMISPGMTRQEVIIRMGEPKYSLPESLIPGGETLVYGSWRKTYTDIMVLLNKDGRVVTVFYSDFHYPPAGGIKLE